MFKYIILFIFVSCNNLPKVMQDKESEVKVIDIHYLANNKWPVEFKNNKIEYLFDQKLVGYLRNILIQSKSDQIAISIIDNNNGNVLALLGRDNENKVDDDNLALKPLSPAASLIKIITSADLLENHEVNRGTTSYFRGKKATLYKYQLQNDRRGKQVDLHRAFSSSNNVVFAKLAAKYSTPLSLFETAQQFYFNEKLPLRSLNIEESYFPVPESNYMFAELASGLNKKTMMSPLHASYMISGILNDGVLKPIQVINNSIDSTLEKKEQRRVLSVNSASELIEMMKSVVLTGTARSLASKAGKKIKENLEFGGKTGRMSGGIPYGTRDWFAFYVKSKEKNDKGWSVAIMINNGEKWTVRPTFIAKKVLEYYYFNKIQNKV